MKIIKAVYREPDSYGDTNFDVEVSVENKHEDIVCETREDTSEERE